MSATLKQKVISSVGWSALDTASRQVLQFAASILLARLLSPEEFGVLGMLLLFTGISGIFVDGGFSSALIQKKDITEIQLSSVFFFNLAMGLLCALFLALAAPWIAGFYRTPVLLPLTQLMAINLFITSFGSVQWALMSKELDFRSQMRISLLSVLVSGFVAIMLAWWGFGVWSLALQTLTATVISTTFVWFIRPWRPKWTFSFRAIRPLFHFGSFVMFANLTEIFSNRLITLLIGKFYSASELGFYSRADSTQQLPGNMLTSVISRVAFPFFSLAGTDKGILLRGMQKAIKSSMFINLPAMVGLAAVAGPAINTLYGEKWMPAVPYLKVLALGGVLWPLHVLNLNFMMATGQSRLFFNLQIIKKLLALVALLIASPFSVMAMAWSQVVCGIICLFINAHYTGLQLGYSPLAQLRDILPAGFAALVMFVFSWAVGFITLPFPVAQLVLQILVGVMVFVGMCIVLKIEPGAEMLEQGRQWWLNFKQVRRGDS